MARGASSTGKGVRRAAPDRQAPAARPPAVGWARSGLLVLLAVSGHYPHHGKCLVFGIDWCKRPTDC